MDKNLEKFINNAKNILLSKEEKDSMRANLESSMRGISAVREPGASRLLSLEASKQSILNIFKLKTMPILAILIALTLTGGGVSAAAENALPGDILYPVKVKANEEIRSLIALSQASKAEWEVRRTERRLEEAEKLAAQGEISAEARVQIEENFSAQAERVNARIAKFKENSDQEGAADISSRFETSLNAHAKILERLAVEKIKVKTEVNALEIKVRNEAKVAMKHREEAEEKLSGEKGERVQTAAEGKLKATENKIEEVKKFIERMKEKLGATATTEAEAKVKIAEDLVAEGKVKLEAKSYGEAFALFQRAHRTAEEAKLLIEGRTKLEINLRLNGKEDRPTSTKASDDEMREEKKNDNERGRTKTDGEENDGEAIDLDIDGEVEIEVEL